MSERDDNDPGLEHVSGLSIEFGDVIKALQTDTKFPPVPPVPQINAYDDHNLASEFYERLVSLINDFNLSLDDQHEVGAVLSHFGKEVVIHITNLGYWNPSLITFSGTSEAGHPVELVQHVSQINLLLIRVARANPSAPKKPIGFSAHDSSD